MTVAARDELHLTPRQREIVGLRLRRLGRREIAYRLGISPDTVRHHLDEARINSGASDEVDLLLAVAHEAAVGTSGA